MSSGEIVIGVVADTHVPDRVKTLHPELINDLRKTGVQHILHAGDISVQRVLEELKQVAPVTAVKGNRDFLMRKMVRTQRLEFNGVRVALLHGHGGLLPYLWDKALHYTLGYDLKRYLRKLARLSGDAEVVIFGHTHHAVSERFQGKLMFNPGSASYGAYRHGPPSFGLVRFYPSGKVETQIVLMRGYRVKNRTWVPYAREETR